MDVDQSGTAIARMNADSKLKRFYYRIKRSNGAKAAIDTLARKVISILNHLAVNREMFEDEAKIKSMIDNLGGFFRRLSLLLQT